MCLRKHGDILPQFGVGVNYGYHFFESGEIHFLHRVLEHQRLGGVVYVLGSESEVDELAQVADSHPTELLLKEILYRLDVMVGHFLDVLYLLGVLGCEVPVDVSETLSQTFVETLKLGERNIA